jgi:hypothetical protein
MVYNLGQQLITVPLKVLPAGLTQATKKRQQRFHHKRKHQQLREHKAGSVATFNNRSLKGKSPYAAITENWIRYIKANKWNCKSNSGRSGIRNLPVRFILGGGATDQPSLVC